VEAIRIKFMEIWLIYRTHIHLFQFEIKMILGWEIDLSINDKFIYKLIIYTQK